MLSIVLSSDTERVDEIYREFHGYHKQHLVHFIYRLYVLLLCDSVTRTNRKANGFSEKESQ